ncbi:hypothetical protein O8B93_24565 [Agrobacterium rhizogenes]|nr:hypothetical protein [Rhizobium rhizogenes]MCZ7450763.1 hypothetical protein [Rhizobium rhizogenes]
MPTSTTSIDISLWNFLFGARFSATAVASDEVVIVCTFSVLA